MRQRALSQKLNENSETFKRPKAFRVSSESFISSGFRGQTIGPEKVSSGSHAYLNHDDINQRAIQIFHTEGAEHRNFQQTITQQLLQVIHPYDRFRRMYDMATVIWVLILVFFIPLEIGFDWFEAPTGQKIFFMCLDFWFAIDILLNFRTGYIHHGTVVMDGKKIAS